MPIVLLARTSAAVYWSVLNLFNTCLRNIQELKWHAWCHHTVYLLHCFVKGCHSSTLKNPSYTSSTITRQARLLIHLLFQHSRFFWRKSLTQYCLCICWLSKVLLWHEQLLWLCDEGSCVLLSFLVHDGEDGWGRLYDCCQSVRSARLNPALSLINTKLSVAIQFELRYLLTMARTQLMLSVIWNTATATSVFACLLRLSMIKNPKRCNIKTNQLKWNSAALWLSRLITSDKRGGGRVISQTFTF